MLEKLYEKLSIRIQICQAIYNKNGDVVDYVILDTNEGFHQELKLAKEEIIGKRISQLFPEFWEEEIIEFGKIIKLGEPDRIKVFVKSLKVWYDIIIFPINDKLFEIVYKNITEEKIIEARLERSQKEAEELVEKLREADRNKDEFIGLLAHEFRNQLATILGGSQLLEFNAREEEDSKLIRCIKRQVEYLTKLTDDLLDINRINENKISLNKKDISLNKLMETILKDIKPQFKCKKIKLLANITSEEIIVRADSLRLTQAIINLLNNALKFNQENSTVQCSLLKESDQSLIIIKDNGIGISPEALPNIFDTFKQDLRQDIKLSSKGLGIGLSLVKEYIEMHGGYAKAYSEGLGKGARFTIGLPILGELHRDKGS